MRSQADLEIPALDLSFDFLFRNRSLDFPLILRMLHFVLMCAENQKLVFEYWAAVLSLTCTLKKDQWFVVLPVVNEH